jgi:hypothetical protein
MNEENFTISKQNEQDLANLFETKYFEALKALVDEELEITKTHMLEKKLSADELRFYQGRAEGLGVILLRIKMIHDAVMKDAK